MADDQLGPGPLRDYARKHTLTAVRVIVDLCQNSKKDAVRLAAAKEILDRGWGRSIQQLEHVGQNVNLLTVLQSSSNSALEMLKQPMMIERSYEEEEPSIEDLLKTNRPRTKLIDNDDEGNDDR